MRPIVKSLAVLAAAAIPALTAAQDAKTKPTPSSPPATATTPSVLAPIEVENGIADFDILSSGKLPTYNIQADAKWLIRNRPPRIPLAARIDSATGSVQQTLDSDAFDMQMELGMRFLLGIPLSNDTIVEVSYWGLNDWFVGLLMSPIVPADDLTTEEIISPFLNGAIVSGNQIYNYGAEVHNLELNRRRLHVETKERSVSTLIGFRYFNDQEHVTAINEQNSELVVAGVPTGMFGGDEQRAQVYNNYVGAQIGAEGARYCGPFTFAAHGTAGAYANIAKVNVVHSATLDGEPDPTASAGGFSDEDVRGAGIFTLGTTMTTEVGSGVSVRVGYEFMFVTGNHFATSELRPLEVTGTDAMGNPTGFALAPGNPLARGDLLFMHGPWAGLEIRW